jgi:hypothetical protein
MKDTEVGQGTEGGGNGETGKEEPRTAGALATPAIVAVKVVALEEENKQRAGELLTAYGSIVTETMITRPSQQQQMQYSQWQQNNPSCQGQCLYYICTWAWGRSIGGRRGIPLSIE